MVIIHCKALLNFVVSFSNCSVFVALIVWGSLLFWSWNIKCIYVVSSIVHSVICHIAANFCKGKMSDRKEKKYSVNFFPE